MYRLPDEMTVFHSDLKEADLRMQEAEIGNGPAEVWNRAAAGKVLDTKDPVLGITA